MANFDDFTIDVKAKLDVDRNTAEACLKLVEMYCNANGKDIVRHKTDSGELEFEFGSAKISDMTCAITKETVEEIKKKLARKNIREGCYG